MRGTVLIDSSVFIRILRDRKDPAETISGWAETRDVATCGMVQVEVLRGVREPASRARLLGYMSVMLFVPTTHKLWLKAANLGWQLDREGRMIPATDLLIAVSALHIGASVLTFDKHFREIPGLDVIESM